MTLPLLEPNHVDEPEQAREYAEVLSRVAAEHQAAVCTWLARILPSDIQSVASNAVLQGNAPSL